MLLSHIAFSHLKNRKRQTLVSVLGVAMGVGFFIGMASMMQGFQQYFITKVISVWPHIIIKDEFRTPPRQPAQLAYPDAAVGVAGVKPREELRGIRDGRALIDELWKMPGVAAAPTLRGQVFLRYGSRDVSANVVGIDPVKERHVTNLEIDIVEGSLDALHTAANGIILGEGLASRIGARLGNTLTAISPAGVIVKVKVVGIFRTGIVAIDNFDAYSLLKKAQIMQNRPNVINQIRLRLADMEQAQQLARVIEARYGYKAESWQESYQNILGVFVIQNGIMYSTVGAILIVAAFGIFNIISTVVLEKSRDIAILKSMGFTETDIRGVFLLQGLVVGLIGTLLGWLLGYGITSLLASIKFSVEGFVKSEGFILYYSLYHYLFAGGFALVASLLAAYLPARKAARVNPVDIIRGAA